MNLINECRSRAKFEFNGDCQHVPNGVIGLVKLQSFLSVYFHPKAPTMAHFGTQPSSTPTKLENRQRWQCKFPLKIIRFFSLFYFQISNLNKTEAEPKIFWSCTMVQFYGKSTADSIRFVNSVLKSLKNFQIIFQIQINFKFF